MTTVIGPVGSEMRVGVPPNSAAKKPTQTAPYNTIAKADHYQKKQKAKIRCNAEIDLPILLPFTIDITILQEPKP